MKLEKVEIKNFRSIKELEIKFDPTCKVLVGINESGKSNILKALSLLDNDTPPTEDDIRETSSEINDMEDDESYVKFTFNLEDEDIDNIFNIVGPKILFNDNEKSIIKINQNELTLREFCAIGYKGIYNVDLCGLSKNENYTVISDSYDISDYWRKPLASALDRTFELQNGEIATLADYSLIYTPDYRAISEEYLEKVSIKDLNELLGSEIIKIISQNKPKCIFWAYDEKKLLPSSVDFNAFTTTPDICVPLQNIFLASKIRDIPKAFADAQRRGGNRVTNLLKKVAINITKHFHNVWKGYEKIYFELRRDGDQIEIIIVENENGYKVSQRSDGFKRFISFLLMISVNVENSLLKNTLLLIDEPDLGLHPSGAEDLRDELIKISEKNYVVYSTHSPFMIDAEKNYHVNVKKKNGETYIDNSQDSSFTDEEAIFNILGYSIFKILRKKNIIFEGRRDVQLFRKAISRIPDTHEQLKGVFKEIGACSANGVTNIRNITPILELAQRKYFIVSDSDDAAKGMQKSYKRNYGDELWKIYDEILPGTKAITGEDFIKLEVIEKVLNKLMLKYPQLANTNPQFDDTGNILSKINDWLDSNGLAKGSEEAKDVIEQIKSDVFDNLEPSHIKDEYYDFLVGLAKIIDKL